MVVDESGDKVHYLDKSMKRRSWDAAMVGRIERKRCDVHVFQERSDAAKTADEVVALAKWAEGKKFRPEVVRDWLDFQIGRDS